MSGLSGQASDIAHTHLPAPLFMIQGEFSALAGLSANPRLHAQTAKTLAVVRFSFIRRKSRSLLKQQAGRISASLRKLTKRSLVMPLRWERES